MPSDDKPPQKQPSGQGDDKGKGRGQKRPKAKFLSLAERLVKETRDIHRGTGEERSEDLIREEVRSAITEVWPHYLNSEIAKACGVHVDHAQESGSEDEE